MSALKLIGGLPHSVLYEIVKTAASLPSVRREVLNNHDDNLWWPQNVNDWRLRMVIAGWSSRISYSNISAFRKVVAEINQIGYRKLCNLSDTELEQLIKPLGLINSRKQYLRSISTFIKGLEEKGKDPAHIPSDDLIRAIVESVKGAGYKVAQCAVLYAKGYHCGVFPVDSGMKDLLGPCIGLDLPKYNPLAHEIMRKHIENILQRHASDYHALAMQLGYRELNIPKNKPPVWWVHLVLIYFKRLYCNKKRPDSCPLRRNPKISGYIGSMCDREHPRRGGFPCIVLEGADKTGKTTLAKEIEKIGYTRIHSAYNPTHIDIFQHYVSLIENTNLPCVFDRIFISEVAYGNVFRGYSRLDTEEVTYLLKLLSIKGCIILYLKENIETMMNRLSSAAGHQIFSPEQLIDLTEEYDKCMRRASEYLPVYEVSLSEIAKERLIEHIEQIIGRS